MSKFFEYVKKIELSSLITESSNTFSYNLPENRKQRLFDFYSFSSLSPLVNDIQSSELRVVKSFAPKKNEQGEASDDSMEETTSFRGARKLNENFVDSFWKAHDKCYVELAKEMLMDIFYCISAEFEHISQDSKYNSEETINKMPEDLREIYKNYLSSDSGYNNRYSKNPIKVPEKKGESGNDYNERYEKAVRSVAMAGKSIFDFAKLCSYVYDTFKFNGKYGGPPWSDAANAFIGIANAIPEKYRSANIFKSLNLEKDVEEVEDSTEVEVPSKDESKKTKYEFDDQKFFNKFSKGTKEQQKEIVDLIAEIHKSFSSSNSKEWKVINTITGEDIIPVELPFNEINGKYLFNLLFNHDNFKGIFGTGSSENANSLVTNRFKKFLDPHKETLNKVFGKIEGKSKFNQIYAKASTTDEYEIILLIEELTKYFEDLKQQEISNFQIYDVVKWEDIFGGNKPKEQEINNLIANYNNFTVVNSDANKVPTAIHSTIRDNINNIFDKYKTVLNKLFGKKQTEKNTDTENTDIKNLLNTFNIKKFHESYDSMGMANIELGNIFDDKSSKYDAFVVEYYSFLKNVKNNINDSSNNFLKLHNKIQILLEDYTSNNKDSNLSKKLSVSDNILNELAAYIIIYNTKINEIFYDLEHLLDEIISSKLLITIKETLSKYEELLIPIYKALSNSDKSEEEKDNPEEENYNPEEDAEEETPKESIEQKSSDSYELTPKERLALFVAIDHTWGLSHNTGPTFNKLKEFTKLSNDGRGMWLVDSLDKRTKDENLFRFINKNTKKSDVSPQIASLIKRIVYSYYGATNEEELYQYVAKTNPKKQVPIHVSDTVYRYIKPNPSSNIYKDDEYFGFPYDIEFNSHYNYWCSLTFKIEYKPLGTECIIAVHVTDHNVTILASDKKDFSFTRDGIQSSGEYVESKKSFTVKDKDDSNAIIAAYKTTLNSLTRKIVKYEGVRIDPDYTSVLSELEMGYDEFKEKINLNSDISLRRITEYGDDLKLANSSVKFQIGDEGLDFIMPHVVMTFVNAERQEETPDVTYGSPDAEEYFAGKRKKPKKAAAIPNIRFSFLAKPEISKTFQFTDDVSTNMKNVIYGYVSKINETGDEGLKRLQKSAVEDFQLGEEKISDIDYNSDVFVSNIPEKYKKIFKKSNIDKGEEILIYGEHDYKFIIKLDKGRLTNPYSVNLLKNDVSIIDKAYRYDSIETIQKNFAVIVEDMISNIKDSEKEEFQNLFKSGGSNYSSFEDEIHKYTQKINVGSNEILKLTTEEADKIKKALKTIDEENLDISTKEYHPAYKSYIIQILDTVAILLSGNTKISTIENTNLSFAGGRFKLTGYFDGYMDFIILTTIDSDEPKISIQSKQWITVNQSNIKKIKELIKGQTRLSVGEPKTPNTIGIKELSQKYGEYIADNYPNYSVGVTNYCIDLFEKISVSINKNPYPLIQYFQKLSILFKYFYDEIDSKLIDESNFEKAFLNVDESDARLVLYFKPISNFQIIVRLRSVNNIVYINCAEANTNAVIINPYANLTIKQDMVNLAILVNKEYDKMVAKGGTTAQASQSATTQTNTNGGRFIDDITSDYLEFLTKNYPNIKEGSEREFYLIAIRSFARQQGNLVKEYYNHFTKVIKFIYDGIQSNIINDKDLAKLESTISGNYATIKFNLKFPLIFKIFSDKTHNEYVSIELLKKTPALYASDFFLDDTVTFNDLNVNKLYTFGKKIKDAFSSTENQNLNDSVNLKELLKSFLLKG